MESSKTHPVTYDGKDALATLIAELTDGKLNDAQARTGLDGYLIEASPGRRQQVEKCIRQLEGTLAILPVQWRRVVMVRVAAKMKRGKARRARDRAFRRQFPALRGSKMLAIARVFYCEHTVENVFVPVVSDYVIEHRRALSESRWKATLVRVRHWHAFANACGLEKAYPWLERLAVLLAWLWNKLHG